MPSPDEPTDWQREMAVEIKREIESAHHAVLKKHESDHVDGDGYSREVDYTVKPDFTVLVMVKQDKCPDHIPRFVNGVDIEMEHGAFRHRFTVDCQATQGEWTGDYVSQWWRCSVVE